MKPPCLSCPRTVVAAIKRLVTRAGIPLHKMTGRYTAFDNQQTGTEGVDVRKVGCSKTVGIHWADRYDRGQTIATDKAARREKFAAVIALLEAAGYRRDHGVIESATSFYIKCEGYDA